MNRSCNDYSSMAEFEVNIIDVAILEPGMLDELG
jgi:hypothetical protein